MAQTIDGFYVVYLTAAGGNGMVALIFRAGRIVGADLGGVRYDGSYKLEGVTYRVEVVVSLPPNILLVQGVTSGSSPETYTIRALRPARVPLPVTETGYLSHFVAAEAVDAAGGPLAYVRDWIEEAAQHPAWRKLQQQRRQLELF